VGIAPKPVRITGSPATDGVGVLVGVTLGVVVGEEAAVVVELPEVQAAAIIAIAVSAIQKRFIGGSFP
jgi:hypothetical protein